VQYCLTEIVQRIFKFGRVQNSSLSPDNETNMMRYGNVFLCHHIQEWYKLLKMVRFFWRTLYMYLSELRTCSPSIGCDDDSHCKHDDDYVHAWLLMYHRVSVCRRVTAVCPLPQTGSSDETSQRVWGRYRAHCQPRFLAAQHSEVRRVLS